MSDCAAFHPTALSISRSIGFLVCSYATATQGRNTVTTPPPSFCFKKSARLLTAAQYQRVFSNVDCKQGGKYFTFLSARNNLCSARLGLVVAKRYLPRAVARNRTKRKIRESFRALVAGGQPLGGAFDVIVLAKPATGRLSDDKLHAELKQQWQKLKQKRLNLSP